MRYLQNEFRQGIYARSETKVQFAVGLGTGLGSVHPYLDKEIQQEVFSRAGKNPHLEYGFGITHIFAYLRRSIREPIFAALMNKNNNDNNELAKGLGTGLGHIFPSL